MQRELVSDQPFERTELLHPYLLRFVYECLYTYVRMYLTGKQLGWQYYGPTLMFGTVSNVAKAAIFLN
jgi:hypothetical protein